ncbi:MAG: Lipid II flippase FtsW [Chlamydiae bacterium]|nr:Lipid II flippase FtsW [Chlamydiota bacterium]
MKASQKYALALVVIVALIFSMGILMVFNTTSAEVLNRSLAVSTHHAFFKQLGYAMLALLCAIGVYFFGYQNTIKLSGFFLVVGTIALVAVFIPGIGQQINGANRWVNLAGYSLQPSELMKLVIPIYFIKALMHEKEKMGFKPFLRLIALLSVPIGLILIEPDNGTVAIILATLAVLFVLTRLKWLYWVVPMLFLAFCGTIAASQKSHVRTRINIYLNPELDLRGKGHQPYQSKIAAGSGGILGRGFGESMQKLDYLPEARSDYIAAIFAEEFGFLGITGLIMLYMSLGGVGFYFALRAREIQGFYLVAILTFLICFQAFLNLGVVSGLLPSKGTNLPFFSHGGSSLMANFIALGLIMSVRKDAKRAAIIR